MAAPVSLFAKGNNIEYSPTAKNIEGNAPYSYTYSVTITSPENASIPFPVTVSPVVTPTSVPVGDAATAKSYVTVSPSQITFTAPDQTQFLTITFTMPDIGLAPDAAPVTFSYQLTTSGWPAGYDIAEFGHSINARVTPPSSPIGGPLVTISTPADLAVFNFTPGQLPTTIPLQFQAVGGASAPITSVDATLDGMPLSLTVSGLGTITATATTAMPISAAGTYTILARAFNAAGAATAISRFTVHVSSVSPTPTPVIVIDDPDAWQVFNHTTGTPLLNIPFKLFSNTNAGFTISSVTATLNGVPVPIGTTSGLGTAATISTGVLNAVPAGTHQLVATAISGGVSVSSSVYFIVVDVPVVVPPTVTIDSPALGAVYTLAGPSVSVPLSFTGVSKMTGGIITDMTATLNGVPVTVSWTAGLSTATATATLNITAPGIYTIGVAARDGVGSAEATRSFTVLASSERAVQGTVFFDVDFSGTRDAGEPGLGGITVTLRNSTGPTVLATQTTAVNGSYSFSVMPGTYVVSVNGPVGLSPTTLNEHSITVAGVAVTVPNTGLGLNFNAMRRLTASGMSHGFWKTNLAKASSTKLNGVQISDAVLQSYTTKLGAFAQSLFNGLTIAGAVAVLSGSSELEVQLLAAEYNYMHGAYIGGSEPLTFAFIYWGEAVAMNPVRYNRAYREFAKDWFDAYNNSHGKVVDGPRP